MIKSFFGSFARPAARRLTTGRARIVMYHRLASRGHSPDRLGVRRFEEQVRHLKRYCTPMRLDQLLEALHRGERLPEHPAVITVDDGYADFAELAYPVLKKHGVPATVFVVTDCAAGRGWLWFDAVRYVLDNAHARAVEVRLGDRSHVAHLSSEALRREAWRTICNYCTSVGVVERERVTRGLAAALHVELPPVPTAEFRALDFADLRALDPALVEIGSHSKSHPIMSFCDDEHLREEVVSSKAELERELGRPVRSFCYPNGTPLDYDARTVAAVEAAGYLGAVVAHGGLAQQVPESRFLLPRLGGMSRPMAWRNEIAGVTQLKEEALLGTGMRALDGAYATAVLLALAG